MGFKTFVIGIILYLSSISLFAQEFEKGNVVLQLGFTLSDYNDYETVNTVFFPFYTTLEFGVHDYVSIGLMGHYFTKTYRKQGEEYNSSIPGYEYASDWRIRENYLSVGTRGAFLITPFLNNVAQTNIPDHLHLFAGVQFGLDIYKRKKENEYKNYPDLSTTNGFGGPFIGARYMFSDFVGAFLELGIGWTGHSGNSHMAATGLAFRF